MQIAGVTCYAQPFPKPLTSLAVVWNTVHGDRWRATAHPPDNDVYEADVEIWDAEAVIDSLYTALKANMGTMTVSLGTDDERFIFGADVLCTTATVAQYGEVSEAGSFKMFSLPLRLRAVAKTFTGDAEWPTVLRVQGGWKGGSSFGVVKNFSQDGTPSYSQTQAMEGIFEGEFLAFTSEMQKIRRNVATLRGAQTTFPDIGVSNPFGTTLPDFSGSYVRVIDLEDMGREDYAFWRCRIKLAYDGEA